MQNAKAELLSELMSLLNEEENATCQIIVDCLTELGYVPERQKVRGYVLSFTNKTVNQTIAKVGIREGKRVSYSIKFYACKNPPERFSKAVRDVIIKTKEQYKCTGCGACGADKETRGYHYTYPNGREFVRCGAYVVEIPDLGTDDVEDFNNLLREQHGYFSARAASVRAE